MRFNILFFTTKSNQLLQGAVESLADDVNNQREEAYKVNEAKQKKKVCLNNIYILGSESCTGRKRKNDAVVWRTIGKVIRD